MTRTDVPIEEMGESLSGLRLRTGLEAMKGSLRRHGQLTAVACYRLRGRLEVADGFKRVVAARALGWERLLVAVHEGDATAAKVLVWTSNRGTGLSEMEEAWVIRSLYRGDGLTQPQIAGLLGHDKSWVCRRLMLAEALAPEVEGWLRLGLLSATAARELHRLPRGNQAETAQEVMRQGLTSRQTARLVDEKLGARGPEAAQERKAGRASPGERLISDVMQMRKVGARLSARLMERSVRSLGEEAAGVLVPSLTELSQQLDALGRQIAKAVEETRRAS